MLLTTNDIILIFVILIINNFNLILLLHTKYCLIITVLLILIILYSKLNYKIKKIFLLTWFIFSSLCFFGESIIIKFNKKSLKYIDTNNYFKTPLWLFSAYFSMSLYILVSFYILWKIIK